MGRGVDMSNKTKKVLGAAVVSSAAVFAGLYTIAKKKKKNYVFENKPEEKNPFEGKKVVFVEDENDKVNADGAKGHLEEIGIVEYKPTFYEKYVKRGMDIVCSFGGLVVLSPIMGAIALAIKVEDPGPVLFTQKRVGQNKQYFKLHKFRSMKMSTPHDTPTHMLDNPDQYITKVGKFIRAHSLDELPQIWDIFVGNMTIIGPRPALWNQDVLTAERDKYGANDVKPGLTGLAQINGRDELVISEKAKLDGEYCKNIGFKVDAKVFFESLGVFSGDDSMVEGGTGELKKNHIEINIPDNILVSVVIATYRRDESLTRALQSLTNQTFKNFEVVIVDDNDNDEWSKKVQDIVKEYHSKLKINYLLNSRNLGSAATRNRGIFESKGQYITFLDDDDIYLPEKIKNQLQDIISIDADYGITDLYLYNEKEELIDKRIRSYIKSTEENDLMRYHLLYHMTGTDTFMFKNKYLEQIGGFPAIDVGDEFYLMKEAILYGGKFVYSNHCYIKAYVHSGEVQGLSSGDSKIKGENALYKEKKQYYMYLSNSDKRYVEMRHNAVLAFAELRRKRTIPFLTYATKAFFRTPIGCIKMVLEHK